MYSVSENYITKMFSRGTRRRLSGTIGSVAFTGDDVVKGSFAVSAKATEKSDTKIGGVYLGQLEMTFCLSFLSKVARDAYEGKELTVYIGLLVDPENDTWVDVPIGVYTLQAPTISKQGVAVSGYDNMSKLDKRFSVDATSASIFGYLSYIGTACNVQIGNTQGEIEALPNGTELLGLYTEENDIETYRDLLYWVAQACGCFACAGRDGKIYLRKFGVPNEIEYDENHRDADVEFSGYTTKWTGVSFVDIATKMTRYYGLEVDDGLTMNLGANPLLQMGSADAVDRRRRAVLNAVAQIRYTPFYMNSARDPIFDLGDEIQFTGGISANCKGCVMSYDYTLTNYSFEGYGDNPALANARSKTDKNIAGLIQTTTENEVTFYNYVNLEDITFSSEQEVTIASLAFTSAQKTTVKIMHEFIFDLLANLGIGGSYEVKYYFDEQLVPYSPYENLGAIPELSTEPPTETEVSIVRDLFYVLKDVEPNERHTWQVRVIFHDVPSITIQTNNAHVTLEGQRLYGTEYFDGYIEVREDFALIPIGFMDVGNITDDVDIDFIQAAVIQATDNIEAYDIASMEMGNITDSIQVFLEGGFYIATEDGKIITTEDGKGIITE